MRAAAKFKIYLLLLVSSILYSCNVTKNLSDGEYLLAKNKISIHYPDSVPRKERVEPYDLTRFIPLTQTPNKKLLGGNFFLWVYNLSDSTKNNGFNRLLRRVGEPPILVDPTLVANISREMELYMSGNGFFNSKLSDTITYKKKKAYVAYSVEANIPYIIDSVGYNFIDNSLRPLILIDSASSLIKTGQPLSRVLMESERSRIATRLENLGYYQFSTENVKYVVDTIGMNNRAKVTIMIGRESNRNIDIKPNKVYRIRNIYVNTNYEPRVGIDTIQYDTLNLGALNFIYARGEKRNIHPDVIARAITLYPNIIYSKEEIDYTSANIQNLKYFKNTSILFSEVETSEDDFISYIDGENIDSQNQIEEGHVDCSILCTPAKRQNYRANFEMSTNSNYTGISLTIGYGNNNIFKRAESFNINATAAYDFMRSTSSRDSYEVGLGLSYAVPRLLAPRAFSRFTNLLGTSTSVDLSYSTQRRPYYDRSMLSGSFGYSWTSNKYFNYTFKPLNIGIIEVPWLDEDFESNIENPYLLSSYKSQMIFGTLTTFRYAKSGDGILSNLNFRTSIETSGNFLRLVSKSLNSQIYSDDSNSYDYYKALGIQYSQYLRAEFEHSSKFNLNSSGSSALVYRVFAGGGYSYGNSTSMPVERMFYVGGSNSMRGWQIRTLGPGGSEEPGEDEYPSQVGNIRLEANLEGRFPVYGPLNGAVFLDAGNIWYNSKDDSSSESQFKLNNFYKQIGFNTGLGARLDFGYFVLRVDWGIQLYNPGLVVGDRWINDFDFSNTAIHFGIGYPF